MIVETEVSFRQRRDPFPYDMTAQGGSVGTSYSFEAIDMDEAKVRIKCSEAQWASLAQVARGTKVRVRLEVKDAKVNGPDGLALPAPAAATRT